MRRKAGGGRTNTGGHEVGSQGVGSQGVAIFAAALTTDLDPCCGSDTHFAIDRRAVVDYGTSHEVMDFFTGSA